MYAHPQDTHTQRQYKGKTMALAAVGLLFRRLVVDPASLAAAASSSAHRISMVSTDCHSTGTSSTLIPWHNITLGNDLASGLRRHLQIQIGPFNTLVRRGPENHQIKHSKTIHFYFVSLIQI